MKKVIAAFDGLRYSECTQNYAIDIALKSDALLVGVFLEDFTYHSYKLFDMIGSQGVSEEKVKHLIQEDAETRRKSVLLFEKACLHANVKHLIHRDKSIALQELLTETIYSDLLVIGAQESLTHFEEEIPTRFIKDLLIDVQCPILITPSVYKKHDRVVLLYDGGPSSVYAAKMFSYMLPALEKLPTAVVSVKTNEEQTTLPQNNLIKEFIQSRYPYANYILLDGEPETEIAKYLENKKNTLVVLGAYRRSMVSRWFKPSMADVLMKASQLPLFIAHYK